MLTALFTTSLPILGNDGNAQRAYLATYSAKDDGITVECEWYREGIPGLQSRMKNMRVFTNGHFTLVLC